MIDIEMTIVNYVIAHDKKELMELSENLKKSLRSISILFSTW